MKNERKSALVYFILVEKDKNIRIDVCTIEKHLDIKQMVEEWAQRFDYVEMRQDFSK